MTYHTPQFPLDNAAVKSLLKATEVDRARNAYDAVYARRMKAAAACNMQEAALLMPRVMAAKMAFMAAERRARGD